MRKVDKLGKKSHIYMTDGGYKFQNVKHRFYRLLFESMKICSYTYNDKLKSCRDNRTVIINNCLRMPLNTLLFQLRDNGQSGYINLGYRVYLDIADITSIRVY